MKNLSGTSKPSVFIYFLLAIIFVCNITACKGLWGKLFNNNNIPKSDSLHSGFYPGKIIDTQLLVWKDPAVDIGKYHAWLADKLSKYSIKRKAVCTFCDDKDSLELWEGPDVRTIISDKALASGNPSTESRPTGGGDDTAFFSYNIVMAMPEPYKREPFIDTNKIETPGHANSTDSITVAVFDTGLYPNIKNVFTRPVPTCIPGGEIGWNYTVPNADTRDDYIGLHGSRVSRFIIDQANKSPAVNINILPIKVQDDSGRGSLYNLLCGFAYAAKSGAKIINASLGFYADTNSHGQALIKAFVKHYLTDNGILLIAAAGNEYKVADDTFSAHHGGNPRDLALHPFYPAYLSGELGNVIAVTTISNSLGTVSPDENFSNTIVDIGVNCDAVDAFKNFGFINPLNNTDLILGSSYATPVISGIIANHYRQLITSPGAIDKKRLLDNMKSQGLISVNAPLTRMVKNGYWSHK